MMKKTTVYKFLLAACVSVSLCGVALVTMGQSNPVSFWKTVKMRTGYPVAGCVNTCVALVPIAANTADGDTSSQFTKEYIIFPSGFDPALMNGSAAAGDMVFRNTNLIRWMVGNGNSSYNYIGPLQDSNLNLGTTAGQRVNMLWNDVEKVQFVDQGNGVRMTFVGMTFAQLATPANGTMVFCTDCNATCTAGAGTGRTCFRENGAWTH